MVTLEQIEKLREKAQVTYGEAKAALEEADGDMLEALIILEGKGKVAPPVGGGYYSSAKENENTSDSKESSDGGKYNGKSNKENLSALVRKFIGLCGVLIHKGNINSIEVVKDGQVKTTFSITVLVVLAIFLFWLTIPVLIIGLFLGYSYRFKGPDLGNDNVNRVMDKAADVAENLKKSFAEDQKDTKQ